MKRAAEVIKNNGSSIIEAWENDVKKEIPASFHSSNLALRNQLPNVLEDIASILSRYDDFEEIKKDERFEEVLKNSLDHGRHRATTSNYTFKQILKEYVVFHRVLTETLVNHNVYSTEVSTVLKYTLETAMLTSASSFSDSLQEMREKLIGTLAHDIRTPISAAYFALDVIRVYREDEERFDRMRDMGLKSLKKSLELLEGLLDAITVRAGEGITMNFEEINLIEELRWVYNEASEIYTNEIIFENQNELITGVFDGTAIRRVVENLVTNAIKYGAREKPVTIKVENLEDDVIIKVHNFGKPIPRENQEDIFKFLNKSSEIESGELDSWGMGLTLVKSVAKAHNGKVELTSSKDRGTTFSIQLNKFANAPGKIRTELNYVENKN